MKVLWEEAAAALSTTHHLRDERHGEAHCPPGNGFTTCSFGHQPGDWHPRQHSATQENSITEDWWYTPRPLHPHQERNFQEPGYLGKTTGQASIHHPLRLAKAGESWEICNWETRNPNYPWRSHVSSRGQHLPNFNSVFWALVCGLLVIWIYIWIPEATAIKGKTVWAPWPCPPLNHIQGGQGPPPLTDCLCPSMKVTSHPNQDWLGWTVLWV